MLHTDGYEIKHGWCAISPAVLTAMEKRAADAEPIFNDNPEQRRNDRHRRQVRLPVRGEWMRFLQKRLHEEYPEHSAQEFVLLESRPGCQRQAAHCDYVPTPELLGAPNSEMPLLFLLALEDETRLEVWPYSHTRSLMSERKTLTLAAGDAVVFRGDLVHAGSAYEKKNIRIHAYLDHSSVERDPNRTWIIYKHATPAARTLIVE